MRGRSLFDGGLSCGETGDGDTEGRAADVAEADVMTELHRVRIATVLPADTAGQVGARATSTFDGHTDELAHTFLVELLEWVYA